MSAGNIKLNLKEFKHVSSDGKSTTLQHKNGHKLTLHHPSLSKESQAQLQELAKGGDVKREYLNEGGGAGHWDNYTAPAPADINKGAAPLHTSSNRTSEQAKSQQDASTKSQNDSRSSWDPDYKPGGPSEAEGGMIKPQMALGGPTPDPMRPCLNPNCKSHGQHHPNCRCYGGMAQGGFVEGQSNDNPSAKEEYFCDMPRHHFKGCNYAHGGEVSQQGQDVRHANKAKRRGDNPEADMANAKSEAKGRAEFERSVKPKMKGLKSGGHPEDAPDMPDDVERGFHHQYITDDPEPSQDEQNADTDKEMQEAADYVDPQHVAAQSAPAAPMASEDPSQTPPASSTIQPDASDPKYDNRAQGLAQSQQPQEAQPDADGYQDLPAAQDTQQQHGNYDPKQDLNPIQRFQNTVQNYDQSKQNLLQGHINEADAWKQDLMNGHIEPLTYQGLFARKDTTNKIGTLFGLLLSGAGSGLAHQPNAVLGMMNQEIQNDLQAQQHSKENAMNYFRLAQSHEANKANIGQTNAMANTAAIANSKARMDWSNFHTLVKNTQSMPEKTPQDIAAKQRANQALAYMNDEIQKAHVSMFDKLASAQAAAQVVGGGLSGGGSGQGSEAAFQQRQKMLQAGMMGPKGQEISRMETARHLPGVAGSASRDVAPADADKFNGYKTLDNQLKDLQNAVHQYSNLKGNIDPRIVAPMAVKAHEAAALYNKTLDGLGMTEGRMEWLDKQIPSNPQAFMERLKGSKEKIDEVANNNNMRKNTMLSNYGFPNQTQGIKPKPGYTIENHNGKNYYVPNKKK